MRQPAAARNTRYQAVDHQRLTEALRAAWSMETSLDPANWSERNTAWGQCAITALIVQDYLGGDLLRGQLPNTSHYWNRLPNGEELDLTATQFDHPLSFSEVSLRTRDSLLTNEATRVRYKKLSANVQALL